MSDFKRSVDPVGKQTLYFQKVLRQVVVILTLICTIVFGNLNSSSAGTVKLLAGTSKINITPKSDEPLHDSLYARSLVLEANGKRLAFVAVDLAIFTSDRLVKICKEKYGLTELFLCSSHTHSEPQNKNRMAFQGNRYVSFYEDQIIKVVGAAVSYLFEARIGAGQRSFPQLGFNRLIVREDGHAKQSWIGDAHYNIENPDRIPFGPVDPEVGIIKVEDMQGNTRHYDELRYACGYCLF